ncbi:MAG: hypothetical protein WCJ31_14720 [Planctomycetia bacterium]
MNQQLLLNCIFGIATTLCLFGKGVTLLKAMHEVPNPDNGGYTTTWLIDYSEGYVRRGLPGHIIRWLYEAFSFEPQWSIFIAAWVTFVSLTAIAFTLFRHRQLCWWPLMLTVCIGGLSPIYRDSLLLLLCMACYWSFAYLRKPWLRYLVTNAIATVAINVHEFGFFLTFPAMALLSTGDEEIKLPSLLRPLVLAPACGAFLLTAMFRGDSETAQGIISNWQGILPSWWDSENLQSITAFAGGEPSSMAATTNKNMLSLWHGIPNFLLFLGELIATFIVITTLPLYKNRHSPEGDVLPFLGAAQLLPMVVVFPFFWDYSRLLGSWSLSTLMCFAIVPMERWCKVLAAIDALGFGIGPCLKPCRLGLSRSLGAVPTWLVVALALMVGMSGVRFNFDSCLGLSVIGSFVHSFAWDIYKSHGDVGTWLRLQGR